jgi:hypothetical protein
VRGAIHSGLDAIPFVGGAKNLAELARGRDFFPDRIARDNAGQTDRAIRPSGRNTGPDITQPV